MGVILPGAKFDKRAVGTLLADGVEVGRTMQCIHCGRHWLWTPGSGIERPYCAHHGGFTCGSKACVRPMPHLSWLEKLELHNKDPLKHPLD